MPRKEHIHFKHVHRHTLKQQERESITDRYYYNDLEHSEWSSFSIVLQSCTFDGLLDVKEYSLYTAWKLNSVGKVMFLKKKVYSLYCTGSVHLFHSAANVLCLYSTENFDLFGGNLNCLYYAENVKVLHSAENVSFAFCSKCEGFVFCWKCALLVFYWKCTLSVFCWKCTLFVFCWKCILGVCCREASAL